MVMFESTTSSHCEHTGMFESTIPCHCEHTGMFESTIPCHCEHTGMHGMFESTSATVTTQASRYV